MTTCTGCGTGDQLAGAKFCHSCGSALSSTCGACAAALAPGARFCSECGAPQGTSPAPLANGGAAADTAKPVASERRMTSILFGDLVAFTARAEVLDKEDARDLLSRFFDECRQIIDRYGGTVEKFIGDAVMAVWGVPTAHEDDAERAVRAGLELTRMVADLGVDLHDDTLAMRVGIVTGEVAVTVGAEQQGMVAGDPVNTASRVQALASPGQVWVDQTTRHLTSAAISYVDAGVHEIKGKVEPLALWTARAVVGSIGGGQREDGLEAPFVGRDRELRLVKEVFHATLDANRPGLLVVDGEPGVGKTRLGWEFFKYTDGLTATTKWHQGRCPAYGEGVAFRALADAVRLRLARAGADDDADLDTRISAGLDAYVPDEEERAWIHPRLAALLGAGSVGTFSREDLFAAWVTFFERVSGGDEIVLMIDDAQHADEGLLSFIDYLLGSATFPCLVLLLTRPGLIEERPTLATNRRSTVLHLEPLDARDMQALVNGLVSGLPEEVSRELVERAEGTPLYAVETVRSLIDRDLVVPRGGEYVLADGEVLDLSAIGAPASLQALVAARLDALAPAERHVVNQASILGPTFSQASLNDLCPGTELDEILASLMRLQILTKDTNRVSAEFGQYRFVQIVVRQVAYGTLSRRDRKVGHVAAARFLEASGEASGEMAGVVAQHYLDAIDAAPADDDAPELEQAAVALLSTAARRARGLGAPSEAVGHLRQALDRVTDPDTRARLESDMASALSDCGRYDEAVERARAATEHFDRVGDELAAATAAAIWARALTTGANVDYDAAIAMTQPRFQALRDRRDARREALLLLRVLVSAESRKGAGRTAELDDVWLRLADLLEDHEQLADVYTSIAIAYGSKGAFSLSRVLFEAAAELARVDHLPISLARTLSNLTSDTVPWDLTAALQLGRDAVTAARRAGVAIWKSYGSANLVLAAFNEGAWDEVDAVLADAPDLWDSENRTVALVVQHLLARARGAAPPELGDEVLEPKADVVDRFWAGLLDVLRIDKTTDRSRAFAALLGAFDAWHTMLGLSDDVVTAWPIVVELALEIDPARIDHLTEVIDGAGTIVPIGLRGHRELTAGRQAMSRPGAEEDVERHLRAAIDLYERWGSRSHRARAQETLGEWLLGQARPDDAEPLLRAARVTYGEIGAQAWLEQLDQRRVPT